MKHLFSLKTALMILFVGSLMFSCKDKESPDLDTNSANDNANAQSGFDDALKVTEDAMTRNGNARLAAPGKPMTDSLCATVDTFIISGNTKKYVITFNNTACLDGRVRSGTITAILVGASYNTPGATLDIVTTNYTVSGHKIMGRKRTTCVSSGVHNIVVSDTGAAQTGYAKIIYATGKEASWKSKRTRTLVSGGGNGSIFDNVYDISTTSGIGNPAAEGINRDGVHYVVNIISPIRINFNCFANNTARYPTQGVLEMTPDGKKTRTIDYGDGTCDNVVKIGIGGKSYTVTLNY